MTSDRPRLALRGLTRRFGGLTAVAPLTLALPAGSVHGILGENGAGKSTLVRLIAGELAPDAGTVEVDGVALPPGAPRAARTAGVGVVHQHFALIGALSVAENLHLGRAEIPDRLLSPARLGAEARALEQRHGLAIGDPSRRCDELPVGAQARVEILRALSGAPTVLLLDEPTATLTPPEIAELFATIRRLRAAGLLVIFITHKLDEALGLCDAITVMRAGRLVTTVAAAALSPPELARLMVGSAAAAGVVSRDAARLPMETAATHALVVTDLATTGEHGRVALPPIGFTLGAGEIVGIAGVDGNGQAELAAALYGLAPRTGTVAVDGTILPPADVRAAQRAGVALLPGDRRHEGLAPNLPVWENALLAVPLLARFTRHGILDAAGAHGFARTLADDYRLSLVSVDQPAATLSGGNQQRLTIGRALALRPRVLIAVNPTRGLDIAASQHVRSLLVAAAAHGTAVLLVSMDLDELLALCSRVFALYRGRLLGPLGPTERDRLGALMAGIGA